MSLSMTLSAYEHPLCRSHPRRTAAGILRNFLCTGSDRFRRQNAKLWRLLAGKTTKGLFDDAIFQRVVRYHNNSPARAQQRWYTFEKVL